jgi:hypothetical protein
MGSAQTVLLNVSEPAAADSDQPIDIALFLAMAELKAEFIDPESSKIAYRAIGGSEMFKQYKELAGGLRFFDLKSLKSREERLAFWINIYNTAVIHGVIELGIEKSVKETPRFFDRITYEIGEHLFSLNEIEHGMLRGNRRPPYGLRRPIRNQDPRLDFAVIPMDPRVHFALTCGARSCPPVGFYEADRIAFQMQLVAESFINSPNVEISPQDMTVSLSRIFKWYRGDFGGHKQGILETLLNFLDESDKKDFLRKNQDRIRNRYQPYDWGLNE